ncbi:MAG: hypothetical protein HYS77_02180, partial [Candidatus Rokubacteria bacterium]|nr:hypothetical protein [Candidatus Rokubacteria bacterium]
MRPSRLAILCVVLYVVLDFSNPLIPGAVSFDPDESVEAVRAGRVAAPAATATPLAPAPPRLQVVLVERPAPARASGTDAPYRCPLRIRRTPAP